MAAIESNTGQVANRSNPLTHLAAVTPSDTVDLVYVSRALFVGTAGDLKVTTLGGEDVTLTGVAAGWHPLRVSRVWATGTDAANIVAGW